MRTGTNTQLVEFRLKYLESNACMLPKHLRAAHDTVVDVVHKSIRLLLPLLVGSKRLTSSGI